MPFYQMLDDHIVENSCVTRPCVTTTSGTNQKREKVHTHDLQIDEIHRNLRVSWRPYFFCLSLGDCSSIVKAMMWKRRRDKVDELNAHHETGELADTNCGAILGDLVATRSWTTVLIAILLASIFLKAAIGLGGYSGTFVFYQADSCYYC